MMLEPFDGSEFLRPIQSLISRYLEENVTLEMAAAQFAQLWREAEAAARSGSARSHSFERLQRETTILRALRHVEPERACKIQELVEAGLARVAAGADGAA